MKLFTITALLLTIVASITVNKIADKMLYNVGATQIMSVPKPYYNDKGSMALHEVQCGYETYHIPVPEEVRDLEGYALGYCLSIDSYITK